MTKIFKYFMFGKYSSLRGCCMHVFLVIYHTLHIISVILIKYIFISLLYQEVQRKNEKIKVLIEKFRTLIQDLNLIVQLETSQ